MSTITKGRAIGVFANAAALGEALVNARGEGNVEIVSVHKTDRKGEIPTGEDAPGPIAHMLLVDGQPCPACRAVVGKPEGAGDRS